MKSHRFRLGTLGSSYHVYARGLDRKPLFHDDRDRRTFLLIVAQVLRDMGARCFAFALMINHYHLVIQAVDRPISDVMHRINLRYAMHHNRRHGGVGHVFQGRFQSVLIIGPEHLLTAIAYVHVNPLADGDVRSEPDLRRYEWSGHAAQMGFCASSIVEVDRVLVWFGGDRESARTALAARISGVHAQKRSASDDAFARYSSLPDFTPVDERDAEDLGLRGLRGVLGDEPRVELAMLQRNERTATRLRLARDGWTVERTLTATCVRLGVSEKRVRSGSRTRPHVRARSVFLHFAVSVLGTATRTAGRLVATQGGATTRACDRGAQIVEDEGITPGEIFSAPWIDDLSGG